MSKLPKGWEFASLIELAGVGGVVADGDWVESKDQDQNGDVRLIQLADIGDGHFIDKSNRFMNSETVKRLNCTHLREGDLLIARMPAPLGRACIFPQIGQPAVTAVDVLIWRPSEKSHGAKPRWLMHTINSPSVRATIARQAGGTTRQRIAGGKLKELQLPVPPLTEQHRIVEKVDNLTTRTARAQADLESIPALVERYKSRILDLAFTGKLTEDLRGGPSTHRSRKKALPEGWTVKSLGEISQIQGGVQVGKKRNLPTELVEIPYLRVANVQRGWLSLDEIKTIAITPAEKDKLLLQTGDILMNEGGDRDKLGRGWVWGGQIAECTYQNHVFRIRLNDKSLPPEFVSHYANEKGQQYFIDQGTQTTNLASISKRKVAALPIPVPPSAEAIEILSRIENAFAWVDRVITDYAAASSLVPKLDAAILAQAFRGELVAQDPNDEPASKLLARIRAEWEVAPKLKRVQKEKRRKAPTKMAQNLESVLTKAGGWLPAQEAFRRCGIADGAGTPAIEALYAELRALNKSGRLEVETVTDEKGRKLHDRLKLKAA